MLLRQACKADGKFQALLPRHGARWRIRSVSHSGLVAPSCSPSVSCFLPPGSPPPSACLACPLVSLTSGHCLSPPASPPWLCSQAGSLRASGNSPSPLLSFVEAAPLGHEAWRGAAAIGGRELHTGRGDRRGGREFGQTHSQPGNCGKAG